MLDGAYGRVYYVRNHELSNTPSSPGPRRPRRRPASTRGPRRLSLLPCPSTNAGGVHQELGQPEPPPTATAPAGPPPGAAGSPARRPWTIGIAPTPAAGLQETHGWVFDVPAKRRAPPVPINRYGPLQPRSCGLSIPPPGRSTRARTPAPRASIVMSRSAWGSCTKGVSCRCCA